MKTSARTSYNKGETSCSGKRPRSAGDEDYTALSRSAVCARTQGNVPVPQGMKTYDDTPDTFLSFTAAQGNVPVPQGMKTQRGIVAGAQLPGNSGKRPRSAGDEDSASTDDTTSSSPACLRETSPFRRG